MCLVYLNAGWFESWSINLHICGKFKLPLGLDQMVHKSGWIREELAFVERKRCRHVQMMCFASISIRSKANARWENRQCVASCGLDEFCCQEKSPSVYLDIAWIVRKARSFITWHPYSVAWFMQKLSGVVVVWFASGYRNEFGECDIFRATLVVCSLVMRKPTT